MYNVKSELISWL